MKDTEKAAIVLGALAALVALLSFFGFKPGGGDQIGTGPREGAKSDNNNAKNQKQKGAGGSATAPGPDPQDTSLAVFFARTAAERLRLSEKAASHLIQVATWGPQQTPEGLYYVTYPIGRFLQPRASRSVTAQGKMYHGYEPDQNGINDFAEDLKSIAL